MTSSFQVRCVAWLMVLLAGWQALISGAGAAELGQRVSARIGGADGISGGGDAFLQAGISATYATYAAAGHVTEDGKRSYQWTSFGQLAEVYQVSAQPLDRFAATGVPGSGIAGIPAWSEYGESQARATFEFDAAGSRAVQELVRTYATGHEKRCITRYLGSYEVEAHASRANATSAYLPSRTLERHQLGAALYTKETTELTGGGTATVVRLAVVLTDHIGSTDAIVRAEWDETAAAWQSAVADLRGERQSFDAWGDRRNAGSWEDLRTTDGANRQTSAMDYDRGFTGHEMLDDFGLIHMNGRIYDPEIGRFLSPDPYVQVPEYSQNFNRYTYVLNNPLSLTDPSGHSWVGDNWKNLLVIVVAVVVAVATYGTASAWSASLISAATAGTSATAATIATATAITTYAISGAMVGFTTGALGAALNGGNAGDILRGAAIGAVSGALSAVAGGIGGITGILARGVVGGASNAALGGKFQDGFISAAASAAASMIPLGEGGRITSTVKAGIVGGTAAELGGGKFANGAYTAAFQQLLVAGTSGFKIPSWRRGEMIYPEGKSNDLNDYFEVYTNGVRGAGREYSQKLANSTQAPVYYNPSNGLIIDLLESGLQKFLGFTGDPLAAGLAQELRNVDHPIAIYAHSQGTITIKNILNYYGGIPEGSTIVLDSPMIPYFQAKIAADIRGVNLIYNHGWGDFSAIIGPSMNPLKTIAGFADPFSGFSIHSRNNSFEN